MMTKFLASPGPQFPQPQPLAEGCMWGYLGLLSSASPCFLSGHCLQGARTLLSLQGPPCPWDGGTDQCRGPTGKASGSDK